MGEKWGGGLLDYWIGGLVDWGAEFFINPLLHESINPFVLLLDPLDNFLRDVVG
jgi:hypothetical protein